MVGLQPLGSEYRDAEIKADTPFLSCGNVVAKIIQMRPRCVVSMGKWQYHPVIHAADESTAGGICMQVIVAGHEALGKSYVRCYKQAYTHTHMHPLMCA